MTTEDGSTNTTTLHFHGIQEMFKPYSDGVPFVTQCPILPGKEFPKGYGFDTNVNGAPPGTYWYHSHVGAQRTNGLQGALIIKDKESPNPHVIDCPRNQTIIVQEWYESPTLQVPV